MSANGCFWYLTSSGEKPGDCKEPIVEKWRRKNISKFGDTFSPIEVAFCEKHKVRGGVLRKQAHLRYGINYLKATESHLERWDSIDTKS